MSSKTTEGTAAVSGASQFSRFFLLRRHLHCPQDAATPEPVNSRGTRLCNRGFTDECYIVKREVIRICIGQKHRSPCSLGDSPRCGEMSSKTTEGTAAVSGASQFSRFFLLRRHLHRPQDAATPEPVNSRGTHLCNRSFTDECYIGKREVIRIGLPLFWRTG